ncbi:MAG: hypothetical protein Q9184_004761 [Pyrenodesmia sp. 2 TL-2023]
MAHIEHMAAGSALCAAAPNSSLFILGRAIAGSGAALLIQGAISVITQIATLEKRPLYIGLVVSCFGISASFSPVLGGALTSRVSWRWCFWINLPIGAAIFFLVVLGLNVKVKKNAMRDLSAAEKFKSLDPPGIILLLSSVTCLFLALQWAGSSFPWSSGRIIGLMIGFGTLSVAFSLLQWWLREKATIPLRILKQRTVLFGTSALFFISMSSNIKMYYVPFYFQAAKGASALRSGVQFLALAVPQVVATVMAGGLATKTGHYVFYAPVPGRLPLIYFRNSFLSWLSVQFEKDVFIGNAIGISVGNNILVSQLLSEVPKHASVIPPQAVIEAGALNLDALTDSRDILHELRQAYGMAISTIMICATATICVSILATLGMQRLNIVKVSRDREALKDPQEIATPVYNVVKEESKEGFQ